MRLFPKRTARQKEIRRSKAERGLVWYQRLGERLRLGAAVFLIVSAAITALIVNLGQDVLGLRVGQEIPRDITSRLTFRVVDQAATDRQRALARDNASDYYRLDTSLLQDLRNRLSSTLRIAREQTDPDKVREKAAEIKVVLDPEGLQEVMRLAGLPDATEFRELVELVTARLRSQPLVEASELAHHRTGVNAVLVDPERGWEWAVPSNELLFANNPDLVGKIEQAVEEAVAGPEVPTGLRQSFKASLMQMLRAETPDTFKPLYRYDTARSIEAARQAERSVPTQYNVFAAGTRLARAGPLTEAELSLLEEEHRQFLAPDLAAQDQETLALLRDAPQRAFYARLARGLAVFLVVVGLGSCMMLVYGEAPGGWRRRLAVGLALLGILLLCRLAYLTTPFPHLSVGAHSLAITLLAITARRGPAYAASGLLALMVTMATRGGLGFLVVLVAVTVVIFLGLGQVRHRGRIIAALTLAALTALVVAQLAGLVEGQRFWFVFRNQAIWAALSTLAAAFLAEGILPGLERLFGVTTNMTLLEWCDPNKPLLRLMAAECPGTYNHSLLVGTLADAAAEAIGANGLLARTGAYYHDIGKINKPHYFVENQGLGADNRHRRLSPAMSHLIIIGHVKDGIEMAREYGLPAALHPFIPEHHGTNVVEYFYHAATRARRPGDPEISDQQFRYPGPKPQSRETAIVMLCDGVEGAVRAMSEPTPNRIEDTVEKIIQKRLTDGQLDECDMTFRELKIIRETLVKSLSSIYHARITYPASETQPESRHAS